MLNISKGAADIPAHSPITQVIMKFLFSHGIEAAVSTFLVDFSLLVDDLLTAGGKQRIHILVPHGIEVLGLAGHGLNQQLAFLGDHGCAVVHPGLDGAGEADGLIAKVVGDDQGLGNQIGVAGVGVGGGSVVQLIGAVVEAVADGSGIPCPPVLFCLGTGMILLYRGEFAVSMGKKQKSMQILLFLCAYLQAICKFCLRLCEFCTIINWKGDGSID